MPGQAVSAQTSRKRATVSAPHWVPMFTTAVDRSFFSGFSNGPHHPFDESTFQYLGNRYCSPIKNRAVPNPTAARRTSSTRLMMAAAQQAHQVAGETNSRQCKKVRHDAPHVCMLRDRLLSRLCPRTFAHPQCWLPRHCHTPLTAYGGIDGSCVRVRSAQDAAQILIQG